MLEFICKYRILLLIIILSFLFYGPLIAAFDNGNLINEGKSDTISKTENFTPDERFLLSVINHTDSLSKQNTDSALNYIVKSSVNIKQTDNEVLLADYYHVYGKVLVQNREIDEGISFLFKSLDLKKKLYGTSDNKLAKTYNYIGIARFRKHEYEEALNNYNKVVKILTNNSFYGRDLFDVYLNIGIVKASLGNFDNAYTYFEMASKIIGIDGGSPDSLAIARFYNSYGLLATFNGKAEQANEYFNKSEDYYIGIYGSDNINLVKLNLNMGVNSFYNLDYQLSKLYYNKVVDIYNSNKQSGPELIKALNNLCVVNNQLGNYNASIEFANRALSYNPDIDMKIVIYLQLCDTYKNLDKNNEVEITYDKILNITERNVVTAKRKIEIYISYADYLNGQNDFENAYKYYKMALDIEGDQNGFKTMLYAEILSKIGIFYLDSGGDVDMALLYFNRSIDVWQDKFETDEDGNIDNSFHDLRFSDAYRGKSKALIKKYELLGGVTFLYKSLDNYEWLLVQLERISRSLQKENQEIIRGMIFPIYNEVINLSYKLYNITSNKYFQEKSFEFSEKSKSAILLASIRNSKAMQTSDISSQTLQMDQELNEEINAIKKQLFDENSKVKKDKKMINFFDSRLLMLLKKHDSLVERLEKNNPKYYSLKYDISVIEMGELRSKLSSDDALVEYQLMDSSLYIYVLTETELFTRRMTLDSSFYHSLEYIINLKNTNIISETRSDFNRFVKSSEQLYSILIQPIYRTLANKNLLIIPSGALGYLPFEILIKPGTKVNELDYRNLSYLIKEFPVSYSYSSTLRFSPLFSGRTYKTNLDILYMAPDYSNTISDTVFKGITELKKLPFAHREVEDLNDEFGGKVYSGNQAVKSKFLETASGYDVLHLAMHTLINDSLPMYSKLVFTPQSGLEEDQVFLNTSEIYKMNLKASMVTLSACNTGAGILKKGEGIMSLARGFVFAGVPSVIMTLWEVQDENGLEIMQLFYKHLSEGYKKDRAMQLAKIEVLNASNMVKSHPNYWSAYIITGDTSEINIGNKKNDLWLILLFAIPILFMFIYYKRVISNIKY